MNVETQIELLAHSLNHEGKRQTLSEHLNNVANLGEKFASDFGEEAAARFVSLVHDIGKAKATWQQRLIQLEAGLNPIFDPIKSDHKMTGAAYAYRLSKAAALIVAGHHGGIPDLSHLQEEMASGVWLDESIVAVVDLMHLPTLDGLAEDYFRILMLFSCLVDADSIDTSDHFGDRLEVPPLDSMSILYQRLLVAETPVSGISDEVLQMRSDVRQACIDAISEPRGFYSLHAPTGSGKTISGGLFALGHAAFHNMRRVVYVAPYRTIIDQTAAVYSRIIGEDNVLPHHSTADFWTGNETDDKLQRQLAENWDVPVVVTTSEQFFESLYSGRPSASRKLHNLVNSVIVIDEPQALPLRLLTPCIAALKALVHDYNCTVLVTTATMLPLNDDELVGEHVTEILKKQFSVKRVRVNTDKFVSALWSEIGSFMAQQNQVLAIANTKVGALRIYESLPVAGRIYISTWLCPLHRGKLIEQIRARLKNGHTCRVASTQVVEAGVDFDFPEVMLREKAPLDSILQAFGRCNRNGLGNGQGYIYSPVEGNMLADYNAGIGCVNELVYKQGRDVYEYETLADYYALLYAQKDLDARRIMEKTKQMSFETIRNEFQLINTAQLHLVVNYGTEEEQAVLAEAIAAIKKGVAEDQKAGEYRWAVRRIQKYVVSVYPQTFEKLSELYPHAIEHLVLNYYFWKGGYSNTTGLGNVVASISGITM